MATPTPTTTLPSATTPFTSHPLSLGWEGVRVESEARRTDERDNEPPKGVEESARGLGPHGWRCREW